MPTRRRARMAAAICLVMLCCAMLALWLGPSLDTRPVPVEVDLGPLIRAEWPSQAQRVDDVLEMTVLESLPISPIYVTPDHSFGGRVVQVLFKWEEPTKIWYFLNLDSSPGSTGVFLDVSIAESTDEANEGGAEGLRDWCRPADTDLLPREFATECSGDVCYCISERIQAAGWPLEQYESRIVVRHRNVIISLDESSSNKYNNRMQTVIDAVAEAIARKAHSSSTESSRSGQEGGPG